MLVASHILPWSKNEQERLNAENGICLSTLYDKGYVGINEKYELLFSKTLKSKTKEPYHEKYFTPLNGSKIKLPAKYYPNKEFLQYHLDMIFKR